MDKMDIFERETKYIFHTYDRQPVVITKGKGSKVWDINGKEYIDCVGGIAVCGVGHRNPFVVKRIKDQLDRLMHISNLYYTDISVDAAEKIAEISGMDKVFFCNSGTEAIEAALKLAIKHTSKNKFIAMKNAFHGRTIGALSVTYKEKFKKPFESFLTDACFVNYGDVSKIEEEIDEDTAAIILEPIQGESGVIVPPDGYLRAVREVCDKNDLLLIVDEVQTGFGRTGRWFAFQHEGIMPDIITMAKGMGGGFPVGAMAAKNDVADFEPGDHGTTFGGNPLACSAVLGVIEAINKDNLIEKSEKDGRYFKEKLIKLKKDVDFIDDVRGKGMMIGLSLNKDANALVSSVLNKGALINATSDKIIRLVPPFVITRDEIDRVVSYIAD
ncbi:acetylornithine transaminase [Candidatus Methanoliparum sp. LAM-1]|uniref:acetylornithine transaminase n=1 Tax=Candidatus Methanoliparum sp. LAM-1 TaxID=2874846 RepID=UPI001E3EDCF2|nr:acetylornithine transaminase [Candidatus Methanoliparum sp. LAM-1]BDC35655.1 aspartate aminotransferase family protein [Candidatus Methanoliparum sp. LAM-1]